MNSQTIRPFCLAVIALPVIAIGASTVGWAESKSFDGAYRGTLECEQGGLEVFRRPLAIIILDGRVTGAAPTPGIDGSQELPLAVGTGRGIVDPDGVFRVGNAAYIPAGNYSLSFDYSGMLNDTGGTLTGTQVFTREITGDGGTRTCKGTFLKVELPRR